MLARLLRRLYLFQMISGALLGGFLAVQSAQAGRGALSLVFIPLSAVLLPLLLQFLVIAISMVRSNAGGQTTLWWRALRGEFRAAITVFVLRMPWAGKRPVVLPQLTPPSADPFKAPAPVPVLLVHGFICNHRVWDDVALALRQAGHPVLAIDLEPLFTSIDDYAVLIEQAVTELLAKSAASQVALVGHSMGGLAIRAWLRAHGSSRVARIVSLGSPHWGTHSVKTSMAPMMPNAGQMAWHSSWLQALDASETPATRALMHIALTHQDNVVYPQRGQTLAGATVTEFNGRGHLQLCLDQALIAWLVQRLAPQDLPHATSSAH